ncbi:ribosomal-protein-alanine acetyltransferase [Legionella massiliensis]|uniref:Ribosomal-protein-alanine acetyltransferase n=1 Tax=Legionella massiliensis TaxID=1034943 RepID=A0A078L2H0_9GAMM|nr:GNAT family N-acetyltransferase [Legionella massiliensis]CDZ78309.1 ribosomal-protein-alanine acetyltransferase [Legionella massiliensis]CEE14047.1 Acetyltransferase (GNAT) family protein [Legionella massiliensis]
MSTLQDILNGETALSELISQNLESTLAEAGFEFELITESDDLDVDEIDLLVEDTFPKNEAESYKAGYLLDSTSNTLCISCKNKGVVVGVIIGSIREQDDFVDLHTLAVDKDFRDKKIGSMLLLALHDIAVELNISSMSLISSAAGKNFYRSFGFNEMALDAFETLLPFAPTLYAKKVTDFSKLNSEVYDTEDEDLAEDAEASEDDADSHAIVLSNDKKRLRPRFPFIENLERENKILHSLTKKDVHDKNGSISSLPNELCLTLP